jgi:drug/metabolite transporter (DMT)-like permease
LPSIGATGAALVVGFCGVGLSLVLFVLALRHLGSARTGAYFSVAPFLGAIIIDCPALGARDSRRSLWARQQVQAAPA